VSNGVATFDEYNVAETGAYTGNYTSTDHPGGQVYPDWYIHMGTPADGGGGSPPPPPPPPPSYVVVREGGTMEGKQYLGDPWTELTSGAAVDIQSAGNQFAYLTSTGELYVKDGLNGSWFDEAGGVSQYVITPNSVAVLEGGTMEAKANLGDPWTELTSGAAVDIQAADQADGTTWFAYLTSTGELYVKDGLNGSWFDEAGGVSQYVITSG
jgi:hypothetical protein